MHADSKRFMLIPFWSSSLLDSVPIPRLLRDQPLLDMLPPDMSRSVHIMLAPRYPKPLVMEWCNFRGMFDGSQMSHAELQAFSQQQPCPCGCLPARFRDVPGAEGHVVTCDAAVLEALCPGQPALPQLWVRGAKYRPHTVLHNSADHAATMLEQVRRAVDALCVRMQRRCHVEAQVLQPWRDAFLGRVSQALDQLPQDMRLAPQDSPTLSTAARRAMKERVLQDYVVTVVDKAATTFVLVCKRHAAALVLRDLSPQSGPSAFTACPESPDVLLARMEADLQHLGFAAQQITLPIYSAIPKMHKLASGALKWRYLSYSANIFSTPLALCLTWLFKCIHSDLTALWQSLPFPASFRERYMSHWVLMNSAEFISVMDDWNSSRTVFQHIQSPNLLSYDFERLYYNLSHQDLDGRLHDLLSEIFMLHPYRDPHTGAELLCHVIVGPDGVPTWVPGPMPVSVHTRARDGPACAFSLELAQAAVSFLIANSYIRVGDQVYRQGVGIPMGTNPAVFIANNYLFMLEKRFFANVLAVFHTSAPASAPRQEAHSVLSMFAHTRRYIDDLALITLEHPDVIQRYFYSSTVSAYGIHGIYPDFLNLAQTSTDGSFTMDFLDLQVTPYILPNGFFGPLVTRLYDKRRSASFAGINIRRFPHIQSLLSDRCKYGVLGGRLIHMSRVVTDPVNFIEEAGRLMADMVYDGYGERKLLRYCRRMSERVAMELGVAPGVGRSRRGHVFSSHQPGLFSAVKSAMHRHLHTLRLAAAYDGNL